MPEYLKVEMFSPVAVCGEECHPIGKCIIRHNEETSTFYGGDENVSADSWTDSIRPCEKQACPAKTWCSPSCWKWGRLDLLTWSCRVNTGVILLRKRPSNSTLEDTSDAVNWWHQGRREMWASVLRTSATDWSEEDLAKQRTSFDGFEGKKDRERFNLVSDTF